MTYRYWLQVGCWGLLLAGCDGSADNATFMSEDLTSKTLVGNQAAYIPAQCYTKTRDAAGKLHNPCMACHIPATAPNYRSDAQLQIAYAFTEYATTNHWANLFKDHSPQMALMKDADVLSYARQNNYQSQANVIDLAEKLRHVPTGWDFDKDGRWSGVVPDAYMNFDSDGFDRNPNNQYTGWRAFAYTPFLGTFWPTNGSTDDVMMRLAEPLRLNAAGQPDQTVYKLNFAIVEALITRKDVAIDPVDERLYGVDLDKDGSLAEASLIKFDWEPLAGRTMSYVGQAKAKQVAGELHLAAGLFPEGTEFLHSVRYLDLDDKGHVKLAARMKELRYARKAGWQTYSQLESSAKAEVLEKVKFSERLRQLIGNVEQGVSNGQGWIYQGFIEDKQGALRPQTYEETTACMGCHGGIGVTTDSNFSFPRKLGQASFQQGWYHWSQQGLQGIPEPKRADGQYEYTHYLAQNGAGDEFRENLEVLEKFLDVTGSLQAEPIARLHGDISELLLPSAARALQLNKAYKTIVDEQSFIDGRDTVIAPSMHVHQRVEEGLATGVTDVIR